MAVIGSLDQQDRLLTRYGTADECRDIASYLRGPYRSVPTETTGRDASATGLVLGDRFVSWLEVRAAVQRLPYLERAVVLLRFVQDKTPTEVSETLHIAERTVQRRQRAGLEMLKAIIYTEWRARDKKAQR